MHNDAPVDLAIKKVEGATTPRARVDWRPSLTGVTSCENCATTTTSLWRRIRGTVTVCNACGVYFNLHGKDRPRELRKDVLFKRKRKSTKPNRRERRKGKVAPTVPTSSTSSTSSTALYLDHEPGELVIAEDEIDAIDMNDMLEVELNEENNIAEETKEEFLIEGKSEVMEIKEEEPWEDMLTIKEEPIENTPSPPPLPPPPKLSPAPKFLTASQLPKLQQFAPAPQLPRLQQPSKGFKLQPFTPQPPKVTGVQQPPKGFNLQPFSPQLPKIVGVGVVSSLPPPPPLLLLPHMQPKPKAKEKKVKPASSTPSPAAESKKRKNLCWSKVESCDNCSTSTTSLWRRIKENTSVVCNACGVYFKAYGKDRPLGLRKDVVLKRKRKSGKQILAEQQASKELAEQESEKALHELEEKIAAAALPQVLEVDNQELGVDKQMLRELEEEDERVLEQLARADEKVLMQGRSEVVMQGRSEVVVQGRSEVVVQGRSEVVAGSAE